MAYVHIAQLVEAIESESIKSGFESQYVQATMLELVKRVVSKTINGVNCLGVQIPLVALYGRLAQKVER